MDSVSKYINETDLYLFDRGDAQRAYYTFGCHRLPEEGEDAYLFVVWAPHARSVSVVGDFNGWDELANPMQHVHNGVWGAVAYGLHDGDLYKYCVVGADGKRQQKADPFAFHAENGLSTASKVWNLQGYDWQDGDYMDRRSESNPQREPMSIYEFHLGSWRLPDDGGLPNYRAVADELAQYCVEMGYTHVEPMPLTEYPLPASWGYQTTGYYAMSSRYGTPQDFMYFVDTLHAHGVGVILDWVPAHFPRDAFALAKFDGQALFEYADPRKGEHKEWGTLVFDYGKPQVVSFLVSAAMFLFDLYHIDGLRVDAVSSMIYLDYGRTEWIPNKDGGNINLEAIAFLQKLNSTVLENYPGAVMAAEESTAYPMVTMPPFVGGLGFTFKWNMGFMHDTLDYAATDPLFRAGNHHALTFSMDYAYSEAFILEYSHDEVVYGKKSMVNKMFGDYDQKFSTLRALMGYQFAHPGKKLTFMGSEFAQFNEWNFQEELEWGMLDFPAHEQMQKYSAALNHFYDDHAAFWLDDTIPEGFIWANKNNRNENAVAFLRRAVPGTATGEVVAECDMADVLCCCNFSPNPIKGLTVGLPHEGRLVEVLNSDEKRFGGASEANLVEITAVRGAFEGQPYHAQVDIPPLSAVYFEYKKDTRGAWQMNQHEECVAMILAGGQGSRLGVLTRYRAKPAVPYGGKYRIIDFTLSNCANSGIGVVGVLTQYEPFILNSYIGTGAPWDLDSPTGGVYVLQPYTRVGDVGSWYAGTADAVYQNVDFIDRFTPDYVVVLSGDHIYKMDYSRMVDFHKSRGADVTIAVMPVPIEEASRFGILDTDDTDLVTAFVEKPENPPNNLASMGVYVFSWQKARRYLVQDADRKDSSHDFGKDVIPTMLNAGERLYAYRFEGYWRDVGTLQSLWDANMDLLEDDPRLDLSDNAWKIYARNPFMPAALVGEDAVLDTCMVPEGCDIDGEVVHSVLFQGVDVGERAKVSDSIVMLSSRIEPGAVVERAILAENVVVGEGAHVGGDGELCVLGAGAVVMPGAHVAPGESVEPDAVVKPPNKRKRKPAAKPDAAAAAEADDAGEKAAEAKPKPRRTTKRKTTKAAEGADGAEAAAKPKAAAKRKPAAKRTSKSSEKEA